MSVDFNSTPQNNPTTDESETPMFAGVPSWERNRKRGLFGGKSRSAAPAAEPAPEPVDERPAMILGEPTTATHADTVDPTHDSFAATTAYVSRGLKKRGSAGPIAIAAGILAIGGLAAAGWYATQPHETGMAKLTPGTEATTTTTTVAPPPEMAANTQPAEAAPAATTATTTTATQAVKPSAKPATRLAATRTRPAPASRSAEEAGVNTAATLPAAPQPYSSTTTAPADTTTASPPVQAAPAPVNPAPTEAAPSPVTPPVQPPPQ